MIDRQKIDERDPFFFVEKQRGIERPFDVYVFFFFHLPILFSIVISALSKKNGERKSRLVPTLYRTSIPIY